MKKEIGGYFELEESSGSEYYKDLYRVNLGRTALLWLAESRGIKHLHMPCYICASVIESCKKAGIFLHFYQLGNDLVPQLSVKQPLAEDTFLYLVNYYGQLTNEQILRYKEKYGNIIVDHTQGFFQRPIPHVDTIYSCRKYFGVSDGAYLSTDIELTSGKETDHSNERMAHILGRYEVDARSFYGQMLDNASHYHSEAIRTMSRLTRNLLRSIDYEKARIQREKNYQLLKELLPSANPFTQTVPEGPFAYPYYHQDGIRLRRELAAKNIFVQTNWTNILKDMPKSSLEYDWAANILPLPCDQRYGEEEMNYIVSCIRKFA